MADGLTVIILLLSPTGSWAWTELGNTYLYIFLSLMASPIRLALINVLRKLKLKSFVVQIVIKLKSDHTLLYNGFLAKFFPIFSAVTSYTTKNEDFRR